MAKKKAATDSERYEYVRAVADFDKGELSWEYKLPGKPEAGMSHDEDISDWTTEEIEDCTRRMLDMKPGETVDIVYP